VFINLQFEATGDEVLATSMKAFLKSYDYKAMQIKATHLNFHVMI
jgi:hypothetical protein